MALVSPSWPHQLSTVSAGNTSTIHILKLLDLIARFMVSRSLNIMVLIVRYTTDGIYTKNTTQMYVALTRCDRVIVECTVNYCCLLP